MSEKKDFERIILPSHRGNRSNKLTKLQYNKIALLYYFNFE